MQISRMFIYGPKRTELRQIVALAGELKPYGQNETEAKDILAHIIVLTNTIQSSFDLLTREGCFEIAPGLLARLEGKDKGAYDALYSASLALGLARRDLEAHRDAAVLLANALTDINNEIGEDPVVKRTMLGVEKFVAEYKGQ